MPVPYVARLATWDSNHHYYSVSPCSAQCRNPWNEWKPNLLHVYYPTSLIPWPYGDPWCSYKLLWETPTSWPSAAPIFLPSRTRFFFCKRGLPSPNISANHMARILSTSYVNVHMHTRTVKCLRDVNDILRHIKIRAIWLAEMQSSFAEKKNRVPYRQ